MTNKFGEEESSGGHYPTRQDVVDFVLAEIRDCKRPRHPRMPLDYNAAAEWLIGILEQHQLGEKPRQVRDSHYVWPYLDRCRGHANKFLHAEKGYQDLILGAREEGIRWRGESMEELAKVVEEFYRMREMGVAAYRKQVKANFRECLGRVSKKQEAA